MCEQVSAYRSARHVVIHGEGYFGIGRHLLQRVNWTDLEFWHSRRPLSKCADRRNLSGGRPDHASDRVASFQRKDSCFVFQQYRRIFGASFNDRSVSSSVLGRDFMFLLAVQIAKAVDL